MTQFIENKDPYYFEYDIVTDFEKYGFEIFDLTFDKYKKEHMKNENLQIETDDYYELEDYLYRIDEEDVDYEEDDDLSLNDWWIKSDNFREDTNVCVIFDDEYDSFEISKIAQDAKLAYLEQTGIIDDVVTEKDSVKSYELSVGEWTKFLYSIDVCYCGVFLSELNIKIPFLAKMFSNAYISINVYSEELIPSVTRKNLTESQIEVLSYAIGRAVHLYWLKTNLGDPLLKSALQRFINRYYPVCNTLCNDLELE